MDKSSGRGRLPFDWWTLALLGLMAAGSSLALTAADWADHLSIVPTVTVFGILAGAALARSRFPPRTATLVASAYGLFVVGWQVGTVLDNELAWRQRVLDLAGRAGVFLSVVAHAQPNRDPLMFVLLMGVVYWTLAVFSAWAIFRHGRLWAGSIPLGLALLVNVYFYLGRPGLDGYLAFYVLLTLVLAARMALWEGQVGWERTGSRVPRGALGQLSQVGLAAGIVLVALAWGTPAFAQSREAAKIWEAVSRPWEDARRRLGDALASLRSPVAYVNEAYGPSLGLEAGRVPSQGIVMNVVAPALKDPSVRYYWRVRTYDLYTEGTWSQAAGQREYFEPRYGDLPLPLYPNRQEVEVAISPQLPALHVLPAPAEPEWIDRSAELTVVRTSSGVADVTEVAAQGVVVKGETYHVRALIAEATADALRQAGSAYPGWVLAQDLQLPPSITAETRQLAASLTAGAATPYDKAVAVTAWLRDNITYSLVTDPPPQGREPIDWFLFQYKVGFCDWYASAEVILLRSAGVPARLAVGYAQGKPLAGGKFEVLGTDAHAWPEVFFPGYGWAEFEPTTSQLPLTRPEASPTAGEQLPPEAITGIERGPGRFPGRDEGGLPGDQGAQLPAALVLRRPVPLAALILVGLTAAMALAWRRAGPGGRQAAAGAVALGLTRLGVSPPAFLRRMQTQPLSPVGSIYGQWSRWLARVGLQPSDRQTPYERAAAFARLQPLGAQAAWTIAGAYARERYGAEEVDLEPVRDAWRGLWPRMLVAWSGRVLSRFQRPVDRRRPAWSTRTDAQKDWLQGTDPRPEDWMVLGRDKE
jgi:transglutaminase-like putative cysteine protease